MNVKNPIPTYVLSGFLGSGKTTLLIELLRFARSEGRKAAVLMNEFGSISIDGELLKGEGFSILELSDGCICCQVGEDLVQAFTEVASRNPEMIFVETTGLADPVDVIDQATTEYLMSLIKIKKMVTVADPKNFPRLSKVLKAIVHRQTQFADTVVISKADEATSEELEEIRQYVQEHNSYASILLANNGQVVNDEKFEWLLAEEDEKIVQENRDRMLDGIGALGNKDHLAHKNFHTFSCQLIHPLDRNKFEIFMRNLPTEIIRAKGFVKFTDDQQLWVTMYVNGDFYLRPVNLSPVPSEHLVFIGSQIDSSELTAGIMNCEVKKMRKSIDYSNNNSSTVPL